MLESSLQESKQKLMSFFAEHSIFEEILANYPMDIHVLMDG
jgi:hypothetical protein